jgi:hypothetical protein
MGWAVIFALIWYRVSTVALVAGLSYLAIASLLLVIGLTSALLLRTAVKQGSDPKRICELETATKLPFLVALQLVIVGMLNIWSIAERVESQFAIFSYGSLVLFLLSTDRLLVLAGRPDQFGGVRSGRIITRLRTRRVLFWWTIVYPFSIVPVAGIMLLLEMKPYPRFFHPPQLCLLMSALYSFAGAALLFQRYRGAPMRQRVTTSVILIFGFCLGLGAIIEIAFRYSLYVYILTTMTVLCLGISTLWLSRARQEAR